jgi:hypothetical protein
MYLEIVSIIKHFFNNEIKKLENDYNVTIANLFNKYKSENE